MALALYRKYRPRTFAEVIGQEQVTEPLMQALRTGRLNHAYLFSGPRGCGKTSSARILARSLNCAQGPTPEPCGECDSCVALAPDGPGSIDVIEIDAASHGGVDDARELREKAFFAPVASRFKVYVIDEAHMVSTQGFNALLKLVEEPPDYVKFVFATTEPEKVLGTIKSRTHHYPFRLIPPSVLRPYLEQLCQQEGVRVESAVFPLVVRAGGGSVRDSLSVLDQLIAGADEQGVTYARAVGLLGVTDAGLIDEMTDALAAGDGAAAFATIERVCDAGHEPRRFIGDLLERLRDLIILQQVPEAAETGIIDAPQDQLERMSTQAAQIGRGTLSRLADIAHEGLTEMRGTTAPRLLLELLVARMLLPGAEDSQAALLQRLERMERRLGAASASEASPSSPPSVPPVDAAEPARPARSSSPPTSPGPAKSSGPPSAQPTAAPRSSAPQPPPAQLPSPPAGAGSTGLDAAAVRRVWDEVLTMVRRRSQRASALIREAMVRDVQGDEIVLTFRHAAHVNMFPAQTDLLAEAVREVLGGDWRFRAELGGDGGSRPAARPRPGAGPSPAGGPGTGAGSGPGTAGRGRADAGPASQSAASQSAASQSAARPSRAAPSRSGAPRASNSPARSNGDDGAPAGRGGSAAARPADDEWPVPARPGGAAIAAQRTADAVDEAWLAADEPPPEPPMYEGFDPGDEPLDDAVDPALARQSSEEQAIRLLAEHLGAEPIGEA